MNAKQLYRLGKDQKAYIKVLQKKLTKEERQLKAINLKIKGMFIKPKRSKKNV